MTLGPRQNVIERALVLAATGDFPARWAIGRALEKEGYTIAEVSQLEGSLISRKLTALCRASRAEAAA